VSTILLARNGSIVLANLTNIHKNLTVTEFSLLLPLDAFWKIGSFYTIHTQSKKIYNFVLLCVSDDFLSVGLKKIAIKCLPFALKVVTLDASFISPFMALVMKF
jgi:hypothetical protein